MNTLISADQSLAIITVLLFVVAVGTWIETRPRIGQFGVIGIIFFCMLLNGLGVMPRAAGIYSLVIEYLVPLAIPMLLFDADIRRIWRDSGRVFIAFLFAALATVTGALVAISLTAIHPEEGVWAGIVAAGFIGSAGNTVAVAAAMGKTADPFMGLLLASVYVATVPFVALLLALPGIPLLWRWFSPNASVSEVPEVAKVNATNTRVSSASLAACLALSGMICWFGDALAAWSGFGPMKFLAITLLSVAVASLLPSAAAKLAGHQQLGHVFLYLFFAVIGVQVDFSQALGSGSQIMLFAVLLLGSHLLLVSVFGRLLGISGPELLIASNACILGPPAAAAMAGARGWHHLVTPGILCGVFGYVVANFIGVAFAGFF